LPCFSDNSDNSDTLHENIFVTGGENGIHWESIDLEVQDCVSELVGLVAIQVDQNIDFQTQNLNIVNNNSTTSTTMAESIIPMIEVDVDIEARTFGQENAPSGSNTVLNSRNHDSKIDFTRSKSKKIQKENDNTQPTDSELENASVAELYSRLQMVESELSEFLQVDSVLNLRMYFLCILFKI